MSKIFSFHNICRVVCQLPEHDDGALQCGGEVEGGVRVPLGRRALAEVADDAALAILGTFEGVRRSHRLRHLGG